MIILQHLSDLETILPKGQLYQVEIPLKVTAYGESS